MLLRTERLTKDYNGFRANPGAEFSFQWNSPPTAIVAASDLMALAALQAIRDVGLQPGRDVAVVGFDDLEAAALAYPPLTTIRQDRQELGTIAASTALELVENADRTPPATILPVELVVRASSVTSPD